MIIAANAGSQSFNSGGPGGGLSGSAANAGTQSFTAGGPGGGFGGSAANAGGKLRFQTAIHEDFS